MHAHAANILCVFDWLDRRNDLVELYFNRLYRLATQAERDSEWRAVQIPRCLIPMLAFTAIRSELDDRTVRAMERLIKVKHGLHRVCAGGHIAQVLVRVARGGVADHDARTRLRVVDRHAEDHLRRRRVVDSHAWLYLVVIREEQQKSAIEGPWRCRQLTA